VIIFSISKQKEFTKAIFIHYQFFPSPLKLEFLILNLLLPTNIVRKIYEML
jgi:hypothetical protein